MRVTHVQNKYTRTRTQKNLNQSLQKRTPCPSPKIGTKYTALRPFLSYEVGDLLLRKADVVVDVVACYPSEIGDGWWEGSLRDRWGLRGRFRWDCICALDDNEVVKRAEDWWFSESGLLADVGGRLWVGPR